jgi:GNAT superfamily N-acetyltransferase
VPGILHQGVLSLYRDDPWLAHDLLGLDRPVDGTPIDRSNELDVHGQRTLQIDPIFPDVVLVYIDPKDRKRGIVIFIEAQLEADPEKRWQILGYQGLLALLHRVDVHVVIVSFSRAYSRLVRRWANCLPRIDALILDADTVGVMTLKQARARPAAAVLVAALHGFRGNIDMARIAIAAIKRLPERRRQGYTATILAALPERQRDTLIKELPVNERNALWEIEKRSGTYLLGCKEGRKKGRQEGRLEGRKKGREEGRASTLIELILAVLDVRGIAVDAANTARIRAERALPTLERWAAEAREVTKVSQLFELRCTGK